MPRSESPENHRLDREYVGVPPPPGVHLPMADELLELCPEKSPRESMTYPSEAPVFWIKYGIRVYWNEVAALSMARRELQRLGSPVRVPAVYYACQHDFRVFIVMDYIPGKTVGQCWKEAGEDGTAKEGIVNQVAMCLSDLHRIPIAPGTRPSAIDGDKARHTLFDEEESPRHYENVDQLEGHLNKFLEITKQRLRVKDLAREPLVFCQSDLYPDNFIIDDTDGRIAAIDLSDASILPCSFAAFAVRTSRLGFDVREQVYIPTTEGVDNTEALFAAYGPMVIGPYGFVETGRRAAGGGQETQASIRQSMEARGYAGPY